MLSTGTYYFCRKNQGTTKSQRNTKEKQSSLNEQKTVLAVSLNTMNRHIWMYLKLLAMTHGDVIIAYSLNIKETSAQQVLQEV